MAAEQAPLTWLLRKRVQGDSAGCWSQWVVCGKADFDAIKAKPLNWGMEYEAVAVVALPHGVMVPQPTEQQAHDMGAKGGPVSEAERRLFEAWMRGHCWALCATWDGKQYISDAEQGGDLDPRAMATRRLWAAWRDRAALGVMEDGRGR